MKTKWKVLCMSFCAACIMLVGNGVTVHAEGLSETTFGYAYDVQRGPAPAQNGEMMHLRGLDAPYNADGSNTDSTNAGNWTLTEIGAYGNVDEALKTDENLESVVSTVTYYYSYLDKNEVCIHELKDGTQHIAYGVIAASDETSKLVFLGNSLYGGAGYLLSTEEMTTSGGVDVEGTRIAPDYANGAQKKVLALDVTDSYTFAEAEEGYAAPAAKEVTVTNISSEESGALVITLEGSDAESFELDKTAITAIAAGAGDTFSVKPKEALSAGTYTATVAVKAAYGNTMNPKAVSFVVSFTVTAGSTPAPADPTPAPADPTPAPADPTPAPAEPTPAPAEPTPAPAEPTPAPAEPTPAPADPTPAPVKPAPAVKDNDDDSSEASAALPELKTTNVAGEQIIGWDAITTALATQTKEKLQSVSGVNQDLLHVDAGGSDKIIPAAAVKAASSSALRGLHVFIGDSDAVTFFTKSDLSGYKETNFAHTDTVADHARTIAFTNKQALGTTVAFHTTVPVKSATVTVYKVDANGRTCIAKTVSNAAGQVCFPMTETATYVLEY